MGNCLTYYHLDHFSLIPVADALSNNDTLKELSVFSPLRERIKEDVGAKWTDISPDVVLEVFPLYKDGCDVLTLTLCNNASIRATYESNHTLRRLFKDDYDYDIEDRLLPEHLKSLLRINQENSKSEARLKIFNSHFTGIYSPSLTLNQMLVSIRPLLG